MKTVFVDVDTQFDFILPAGALYAPGAETILARVAALNQFAAARSIPLISTMDAQSEDDPEFLEWHPHCVVGTISQGKPASTLLEKRVVIPSRRAQFDFRGAQQIILEKQNVDMFTNENVEAILDELATERFVVYGLVTEVCVRCAAAGLLRRGKRVELVEDAVRAIDEQAAHVFLESFVSSGGVLTTTAAVMAV